MVRLILFSCFVFYAIALSVAAQVVPAGDINDALKEPKNDSKLQNNGSPDATTGSLPILKCPAGFNLVEGVCSQIKTTEGTFSCPKDTDYFENGKCIKTEKVSPKVSCPEGSTTDGKKCILLSMVAPDVSCAKDYRLSDDGKDCVRNVATSPSYSCPPGYNLDKKTNDCISYRKQPLIPKCPEGYVLQTNSSKSDECLAVSLVAPVASCPKDFEPSGKDCIKTSVKHPRSSCKIGLNRDDEFCETVKHTEATEVCPAGRYDSSKKICSITEILPVLPACKKDYIYEYNRCKKIDIAPATESCPKGYKKNAAGTCLKTDSIQAQYVCPAGTISRGKDCVYEVEGGIELFCDKGSLGDGGVCMQREVAKITNVCPHNFQEEKGICVQITSIAPDIACPENSRLDGKYCIQYSSVTAEITCKDGSSPTAPNQCTRDERVQPTEICHEGYFHRGDACVKTLHTDLQYVCPHGTYLNRHNQCQRDVTVPPQLSCKKGFALNERGECFTTDFADASLSCPSHYELRGTVCEPKGHDEKRKLGITPFNSWSKSFENAYSKFHAILGL